MTHISNALTVWSSPWILFIARKRVRSIFN